MLSLTSAAKRIATSLLTSLRHRGLVTKWLLALMAGTLAVTRAEARESVTLGPAVTRPFGQAAALQRGGTAANADLSTLDHNPAGLSLGRALTIEGATAWRRENIQASELGIIDSVMSSVAAGIKFRQTSSVTGSRERRFSLGLANAFAQSKLLVGIAGDYKERPKVDDQDLITDDETAFEVRGGAIYAISESFRLAASTGGHIDKQTSPNHTIGAAMMLGPHFVVNLDQMFERSSNTKTTGGLGIVFGKFFDLRGSFGHYSETKRQEGALGFFLVSPRATLYYVASLPDIQEPLIEHQAGLRLNMGL